MSVTTPVDVSRKPYLGGTAVITGAGSGIGRAIALALAHEGMRVLLIGRRVAPLRATAEMAGPTAELVPADIATPEGIAAVADAAQPTLRALVHCAGHYCYGPVVSSSHSAWTEAAAVNLNAPMLLTAACLGHLRAGRGDVVFVNSSVGLRPPGAGAAIYAATKHALRAAADALRQEVNGYGIRVVSVFPGRTDTPMQTVAQEAEGRRISPDRLLSPDDVADIVLATLRLPARAEVTEVAIRPSLPPA
jgi:NADP-dependent 3-hydroxy acid dehydrogenase YdfG